MNDFNIVPYADAQHRAQVVALWRAAFGYEAAHNAPELTIDKKLAAADGLFFAAESNAQVIGSIMAGYDGHRGWIYSLAVSPGHRGQGAGKALLERALRELAARGCLKVNLQIVAGNETVQAFYEANGFSVEDRISMGTRL
ncbi:MAG: hypothetical protein PWQ57_2907 [Desulfovibrionales bacterium]|nr:hypothetical protein [Desulfovibrionales bacterium]